ncbi:MAG: hypothetical protein JWL82_49 [Parcubacteria group bacterium]|nr:hypothetical protein [Parcubacteria group bacterium]
MIDSTTTFIKRLAGIRLSNNERLALRERLSMYADQHPAPVPASIPSPFGTFFIALGSRRFSTYAMALAVLIVATSGVTFAAEGSVPGDSLYSIKVKVNEPVMVALAPTATGQANVAARIATRRVDEAVTLATRGELTPERQAYLATEFDSSVKIAAQKADDLASSGDVTSAANVKANLAANLAGEAQALGAVATVPGEVRNNDFLAVVVATSESISSTSGSDTSSAAIAAGISESASDSEEGTTTALLMEQSSAPASARTMLKAATLAPVASTTPLKAKRAFITGRFGSTFNLASSTLRARLAAPALSNFLVPKMDVAIPKVPQTMAPEAVVNSETTTSGSNSPDTK